MRIRISDYDKDRLKSIPISEVVARFDNLKKKGSHWVALCPWHDDHDPSLTLYEGTNQNHCHCHACGHHADVIAYVERQLELSGQPHGFNDACEWLSRQFGIPIGGAIAEPQQMPVTVRRDVEKKPQLLAYVPKAVVESTVTVDNPFGRCLQQLFDPADVERVTRDYCLGLYIDRNHDEHTIFWSIDKEGRVHNGKIQRYCTDPASPHFAHSDPGTKAIWLTNEPILKRITPPGYRLDGNGPFGFHLLRDRPFTDQVFVVESPKNALIGAAWMPECLWLATGNKTGLTPAVLRMLRGRWGVIYPDRDAVEDWTARLAAFDEPCNFEVHDFCKDHAPVNDLKYDIADYIIDAKLQGER